MRNSIDWFRLAWPWPPLLLFIFSPTLNSILYFLSFLQWFKLCFWMFFNHSFSNIRFFEVLDFRTNMKRSADWSLWRPRPDHGAPAGLNKSALARLEIIKKQTSPAYRRIAGLGQSASLGRPSGRPTCLSWEAESFILILKTFHSRHPIFESCSLYLFSNNYSMLLWSLTLNSNLDFPKDQYDHACGRILLEKNQNSEL